MRDKWGSFLDFVRSEEDGTIWASPSYRAYDLDHLTGLHTLVQALKALRRTEMEVKDDLVALGAPVSDLKGRLVRWYVWYRLNTGELLKWPLRTKIPELGSAQRPNAPPEPDSPA